jgi:hypothetical protein
VSSVDSVYDLYRNSPVVWVEDELTRDVLVTLWGPSRIAVAVAGTKNGVRALVQGAPRDRAPRIVGYVDRDFDRSNRDRWKTPECRIFCSVGHECENDLLDFEALAAASNRGVSAQELEAAARVYATQLVVWMACKATLRTAKEHIQGTFPGDPPLGRVPDLAAAESYILSSPAWSNGPAAWRDWSGAHHVHNELERHETTYRDSLTTTRWLALFSGKEILRHLRGQNQLGLESSVAKSNSLTRDLDLARRITRKMVDQDRIPPALLELRGIVLAR